MKNYVKTFEAFQVNSNGELEKVPVKLNDPKLEGLSGLSTTNGIDSFAYQNQALYKAVIMRAAIRKFESIFDVKFNEPTRGDKTVATKNASRFRMFRCVSSEIQFVEQFSTTEPGKISFVWALVKDKGVYLVKEPNKSDSVVVSSGLRAFEDGLPNHKKDLVSTWETSRDERKREYEYAIRK